VEAASHGRDGVRASRTAETVPPELELPRQRPVSGPLMPAAKGYCGWGACLGHAAGRRARWPAGHRPRLRCPVDHPRGMVAHAPADRAVRVLTASRPLVRCAVLLDSWVGMPFRRSGLQSELPTWFAFCAAGLAAGTPIGGKAGWFGLLVGILGGISAVYHATSTSGTGTAAAMGGPSTRTSTSSRSRGCIGGPFSLQRSAM